MKNAKTLILLTLILCLATGCGGDGSETDENDGVPAALTSIPFSFDTCSSTDGDVLTVSSVKGTASNVTDGAEFEMAGSYTLASRDSAEIIGTNSAPAGTDGSVPEVQEVTRGNGAYTVTFKVLDVQPGTENEIDIGFFPSGGGNQFFGSDYGCGPITLWSAPTPPGGVTAGEGDSQASIGWNPVSGASSYNIYWSLSPGASKTTGTRIENASSPYTHTGLTNNTTYYYVVTAVNAVGESPESAEVSATPIAAGTAPQAPSGVRAVANNELVTISWQAASDAVSYNIYYSTSSGVTKYSGIKIAGVTSPYTHTGLTNNTTYYYVVTAVNAVGESPESAEVSATPIVAGTAPQAPSGVRAVANNELVTISWQAASDAVSYNIYYSTSSGVTKYSGIKIAGVTSPYSHAGLSNGTAYYYVATSENIYGESADSLVVSATPSSSYWKGSIQFGTAFAEVGNDIALDSNGNAYITGYTNGGLDGNVNAGSNDAYLMMYDSSGTRQWTRQFGTTSSDLGYGIAIDANGNIYAAGVTAGGLDNNVSAGSDDIFLVKFDASGTKQWTRQAGSTGSDITQGIAIDANGNIYVAGYTSGALDGNSNAGSNDVLLIKYDSSGAKLWTRQLGSAGDEIGTRLSIDANGNIYVAGYTSGGLDGNSNAGLNDIFLIKYDPSGAKLWTRQIGSPGDDTGYGIAIDGSGNAYIAGYTSGELDGNTSSGDADIALVKYDPSGVKQWTSQYGTLFWDGAYDLAIDSDGSVYVTGYTSGSLDGVTSSGQSSIFLVRYDASDSREWTRQYPSAFVLSAKGIAVDGRGHAYITGSTSSQSTSILILVYDSNGVLQ